MAWIPVQLECGIGFGRSGGVRGIGGLENNSQKSKYSDARKDLERVGKPCLFIPMANWKTMVPGIYAVI